MFKQKRKLFINDAQVSKVLKEIVGKKMKGNSVEETAPSWNNWIRSFNALMRVTPPDFNRLLKS